VRHGDAGYASLWVHDEARARQFFSQVLGWPEVAHRPAGPGSIDQGLAASDRIQIPTLMVAWGVDDVDEAVDRIRAAGGDADAPTSEPWGRTALCTGPDGLPLAVYALPAANERAPRSQPNGARHGDLAYITIEASDSSVARRFYQDVLGWLFTPGHVADGWQVPDTVPMTGLVGGRSTPRLVPMYRVDDIHDAVQHVADAGGEASDPTQQSYGWQALCQDDQGTAFYLGQL
jgi:predicted enzyme related to lactoylglutathione lyase